MEIIWLCNLLNWIDFEELSSSIERQRNAWITFSRFVSLWDPCGTTSFKSLIAHFHHDNIRDLIGEFLLNLPLFKKGHCFFWLVGVCTLLWCIFEGESRDVHETGRGWGWLSRSPSPFSILFPIPTKFHTRIKFPMENFSCWFFFFLKINQLKLPKFNRIVKFITKFFNMISFTWKNWI